MQLAEFMELEELDDAALGAKIKRSRVTVSRYRRGLEPIPGDVVKLLVEISSGRMTANELLGIEDRFQGRAARRSTEVAR
jgi:hypothetical protein